MRKIKFDEETIKNINDFIREGHTKKETCNRFNIRLDTLNRVMRENNIKPYYENKISYKREIKQEEINLVCNLFKNTNMTIDTICDEVKLKNYIVQEILYSNFTQEEIDKRKSKLYRLSKLEEKNPMYGKYGKQHHNYKGVISDGKGYLMILKPDWYTGRKNSKHVYLHDVIICEQLGLTELPKNYVVHHVDGNKTNNSIDNLCLITLAGHSKLHQMQRKMCKVQRLSDNGVGETRNAEQQSPKK